MLRARALKAARTKAKAASKAAAEAAAASAGPDVIVTNSNNSNSNNNDNLVANGNLDVDPIGHAHQRAICVVATLIQVNNTVLLLSIEGHRHIRYIRIQAMCDTVGTFSLCV